MAAELSYEIHLDTLDQEWVDHPGMVNVQARAAAKAKRVVKELERELKVAEAELGKQIRLRPGKFKLDKVTEAAVKEIITLHPNIQKLEQAIIDAEYRSDILFASVKSLDKKTSALENLVKLHGQNYFSTPTAGKEYADKVRELERSITRKPLSVNKKKKKA